MIEWVVAVEWRDDRGTGWVARKTAYAEDASSAVMLVLTEAPEQVRWGVYTIHVRKRTGRNNI